MTWQWYIENRTIMRSHVFTVCNFLFFVAQHPGVCQQVDTCNSTDSQYHSTLCLMDGDCGRLEKCCSDGCGMRCTTDIKDSGKSGCMPTGRHL